MAADPDGADPPAGKPAASRRPLSATIADPPESGYRLGETIRDSDSAIRGGDDSTPPAIAAASLAARLPTGLASGDDAHRYRFGALIGHGATSQVFAAKDHTFDRDIAVKLLRADRVGDGQMMARFIKEARLTATLEHPNIAPIYDMDFTADGGMYFTMRMIAGQSLGAAIMLAAAGTPPPALATANDLVTIFLKLCDALACAHDHRIVHRDIKPDNVMLGGFGEVVLVDWGSAAHLASSPAPGRPIGTPLYMSPEQARGEAADERSDIHCLGASLFEALIQRPPTARAEADEFWPRRRAGEIDAPTAAELERAPRKLVAIALKAMAAQPERRYQRIDELRDDLARWQAGLAISAYRDSLAERIRRWHGRHARAIWATAAAVAAVLGLALLLYGERLKEIATWGEPVLSESFDADWRQRWQVTDGSFEVRDGRLVSTGGTGCVAYYRKRLSGSVAIEFDGEMLPGCLPCDLSVRWSEGDPFDTRAPSNHGARSINLQTGAVDNSYALITGGHDGARYSLDPGFKLRHGVTYHIRAEIDGTRLAIFADGRRLCSYDDLLPFASGYVALYAYYPGKAFSRVRIYRKGVAEKIAATAIGDAFLRRGEYAQAADEYQHIAEVHAGRPLAIEARYKQGLGLLRDGRELAAFEIWDTLPTGPWQGLAECQRLESEFAAGHHQQIEAAFAALYAARPDLREQLRITWETLARQLTHSGDWAQAAGYLDLQARLFPDDPTPCDIVAYMLSVLGRHVEIPSRCPYERQSCARALCALGRDEEAMQRFPDLYGNARARLNLGRFDALIADPTSGRDLVLLALLASGGTQPRSDADSLGMLGLDEERDLAIGRGSAADLLALPSLGAGQHLRALQVLGRDAEALAMRDRSPGEAIPVMLRAGRDAELLGRFAHIEDRTRWIRWHQALRLRIAGDRAGEQAARALLDAQPFSFNAGNIWFAELIMRPFLAWLDGDREALTRAARTAEADHRTHFGQRPWHALRAIAGRCDDAEFLAQPARAEAPALLSLCRGIRAELAGDRAAAVIAYRDYLALPAHLRRIDATERVCVAGDPVPEEFARWRADQCALTPAPAPARP